MPLQEIAEKHPDSDALLINTKCVGGGGRSVYNVVDVMSWR